MQLAVDDSEASLIVQLLVKYVGATVNTRFQQDKAPVLTTEGGDKGETIEGVLPIAKTVLSKSNHSELLGVTEDDKKEIEKSAKNLLTDFLPSAKEKDNKFTAKLHKFNKQLLPVVFFSGNRMTIVDLIAFVILHPTVRGWSSAEKLSLCNLTRWFDNIQHTEGIKGALPSLPIVPINRFADAAEYSQVEQKEQKKKAPTQQKTESPKQELKKEAPKEQPAKEAKPTEPPKKETKEPSKKETKEPPKKETKEPAAKQAAGDKKQQAKPEQKQDAKKQEAAPKGKQEEKKKGAKQEASPDNPIDVSRLDLKVGKILTVKKHEQADTLYVETIDVGEEKPRQVVSGLVKFIPIEEMQNRMVVVLCNLKAANMRGVKSEAMVLAGSNTEHTQVELVDPPAGAKIGERVSFEKFVGDPEQVLNPKLKMWEAIQPELKTNDECVATYRGDPFKTSAGVCKVKSIKGGNIK